MRNTVTEIYNSINKTNYDFDNTNLLSQMISSKDRKEILKKSRWYVWNTGLVYRLIKLKVDFICSGFDIRDEDTKIENYYKDLYDNLDVDTFIRNFAFENQVMNEVYPFYNWQGNEPEHISILNPELVITKSVLGKDLIYLKPSNITVQLLNSTDKEEQRIIRKVIPKKVATKWKKGEAALLDSDTAKRYYSLKAYHEQYAHSNIQPIMKDLLLLHELIDSDYSVTKKIKNLITLFSIGDEKLNGGIVDQKLLDNFKEVIKSPNPSAKALEFILPWYVNIDFPCPPVEEIYNSDKYKAVIDRILDWSGMRIFFGGDSSSYASGYLKVKVAKQEVENGRKLIKKALNDLNRKISKKKGWVTYGNKPKIPEIVFNKNALTDEKFMLEVSKFLFTYGLLSEEQVSKEFGYNFARQMKKKKENAKYAEQLKLHFEPSQGLLSDDENDNEKLKSKDDKNSDTPRN